MSFRWKAILLALAIGVGAVIGSAVLIAVPFLDRLPLGDDLLNIIMIILVTALPFLSLALLAERSRLLWGAVLAVTVLLWGWYVVMAIDYRAHGSHVLAHMGFDVVLFFYPFVLTAILVAISLFRRAWSR